MSKIERKKLRTDFFYNGAKPDQEAFNNIFDSFFHVSEDGFQKEEIAGQPYITFKNGIRIGNFPDENGDEGILRYNSVTNKLEVHDGNDFQVVGLGENSDGFALIGDDSIAYNGLGTVGIGVGPDVIPDYKLDVFLAAQTNSGEGDTNNQVRFGAAVLSKGEGGLDNDACFSHENFANNDGFAIRHTDRGSLILNSTSTSSIRRGIFFNIGGATSTRMRLDGQGRLGIGTINPEKALHVVGDIKADNLGELSDIRYKKEITPLANCLEKVEALNGISYLKKESIVSTKQNKPNIQIGLVAQEVEKVIPELVDTDSKGFKSISYTRLSPLLIEAIKELSTENKTLKEQVKKMENRLKAIIDKK